MNTEEKPESETEAEAYDIGSKDGMIVSASFAFRLEKERDAAREIAGRLATLLSLSNGLQESEDWSCCYRKTQLQIIHNQLTEYETMSASWKK